MSHVAVSPRARNAILAASIVAAASAAGVAVVARGAPPEPRARPAPAAAAAERVDVAALPFAKLLGLSGHVEVAATATGELALSCTDCRIDYDPRGRGVRVGPIAIDRSGSAGPRSAGDGRRGVSIDRLDARVAIANGRVSITSWRLASRDVRLEVALDVQVAPHLDDSAVTGCVAFAPTAALRARDPRLASMLQTSGATLGADGLYQIRLAGTLGDVKKLGQVCDGSAPVTDDLDAAIARGVAKVGPGHYEIRRALVDRVLADPMAVARTARLVPAVSDGRPQGFKVYAIRAGSLLAALGLQNGDTLVSINGYDLMSPDKALEAYSAVRDSSTVELAFVRHGTAMTLDYVITP